MRPHTESLLISIKFYLSAVLAKTTHAWNVDYYYDDASQFDDTFHSSVAAPAPNHRQHSPYHRSSCDCIKLKDCTTITFKIRNAPKPLTTNIMKDIRKKACGFIGNDPYICCPPPPPPSAIDILPRSFRDMTSEKPWIWDVSIDRNAESKPLDQQSTNLFNRIGGSSNTNAWNNIHFPRPNDFNAMTQKPYPNKNLYPRKIHFFDFEDPNHSYRNCPPSFSDDFNIPTHFQHVRPIKKIPNIPNNNERATMPPILTTHSHTNSHSIGFDLNSVDTDPSIVFPSRSNAAVDTPTFPSHASKFPPEKLNLVNQENCGISIGARIIGGTNSIPGQFPWYASLKHRINLVNI